MATKKFKDGEIIFREGDPSDSAFVIESGVVELTKASDNEPVQLAFLNKGEMFGEMGILDGSTRSATATAEGKVTLRVIDRETFLDRLQNEPDMALNVINKLVERLRHADDLLAQGPARAAVSQVRRDPAQAAKPGFFRRLLGMGADTNSETIEVWIANLAGEGGDERAKQLAAILDKIKGLRVRLVKQGLESDPSLPPDQRFRVLAESARQWLLKKQGDLLIWGEIPAPETTLHLRFVSAAEDKTDRPGTFTPGTVLTLPVEFPPEFGNVLAAVALAATIPANDEKTAALTQLLPEALEGAMPLVKDLPPELVSRERAAIQLCFGNALATVAVRGNSAELYQVAAQTYRSALDGLSRDADPVEWATLQKHLGSVLQVLAEKTNDPETMGAAANVFRLALEVFTEQAHPFDWASLQYRLGQVLYRLDLKTGDTGLLKEALGSFQAALHVFKREEDPARWADIMNGIAQTAQVLGRELRNVEILEKAAEACDGALEVRTKDEYPLHYAATQNNLGSALFLLGRMTEQAGYYKEAAVAFQEARDTYKEQGSDKMAAIAARNLHHVEEASPGVKASIDAQNSRPPAWFEEGDDEKP